jgi:hypothetical protein
LELRLSHQFLDTLAEARTATQEAWRAKDEELKAEKAQIENKIKNSTGAVREQWKYRLAVLKEKVT